jgi:hypothetical protein
MIPYVGPLLALQDSISNEQKMELSQKIMKDPDLPAWYEAREKITMAVGDRIVDSDVESVYRAVITGLSTLEVNIENVEKESGFINGSGKILPPDRAASFRKERMVEYAKANGMNPKAADPGPFFDPETMSAVMEQATGMTITVGPHGDGKTKVKVRFSKIYYPAELQECYSIFWQSVDKQGFLDQALDSPAETVKPQ